MTANRNASTAILFFSALLALSILTGCKEAPSAAAIESQLERYVPGLRLERESHIRIPRIAMAVGRRLMRLASTEDQEDLKIISHVKRVSVATYRVTSLPDSETLDVPVRFDERLAKNGWDLLVREREDDGQTWLFTRQGQGDAITNLYVVELDRYELTVVDLAGRIDRIFAEALADNPGEVIEIFG